jgi:hypothetical protein
MAGGICCFLAYFFSSFSLILSPHATIGREDEVYPGVVRFGGDAFQQLKIMGHAAFHAVNGR